MAGDEKNELGDGNSQLPDVEYHYIKSNDFRVIHADGAIGSVTGRGYLNLAFYNERRAIPQKTTVSFDADTKVPHESVTATRGGVVREVEVGVLLDARTTAELIEWLRTKLEDLHKVNELLTGRDKKGNA